MPLGGVAVVDRTLGEGEAVMGAGIDLDFGFGAAHALLHLLDDFAGGVDVGLGAGEVEFGLGLGGREMRAVVLVGCELRAVDRGGGLDAIGEMRGGVDRVAAAHAVAYSADQFGVRGRLALGIGEQRPRV